MSGVSTETNKKLDESIPREVISERDAGGGKKLSYIETWYVIDRLNQVLGNLNWSNEILELTQLPGGELPMYRATVRLTVLNVDGYGSKVVKDGIGFGSDKYKGKNTHELAMKEAVSDALKVAAKNLGRSVGLALYDRSQEFITDSPAATESGKPAVSSGTEAPAKSTGSKAKADPRETIRSAFKVLEAQKKINKTEFSEKYLSGKASKDLTDSEAQTALNLIKTDFKELSL